MILKWNIIVPLQNKSTIVISTNGVPISTKLKYETSNFEITFYTIKLQEVWAPSAENG